MKKFLSILAITLLLAPFAVSQSRETGAVRGVVTDDQNVPLPGVNVTLTGGNLMGMRTFVTDVNGEFRFPALPPGEYQVKAEIQGFGPVVRENIRVNTTATLTVDIQLKPAAVAEEVTVIAQSPTVDIKSTETASVTLSNEILRNIPYNQFTSDIVNMAPGVNDDVAFGAQSGTGINYNVDGVGVADPSGGTAWVFLDHNIIEEAKVMGVGLPAEYGNFTGVIFNLVTKSGGNKFSGHVEFNRQLSSATGKFWQAQNNGAYLTDFPELSSPSYNLFDLNAHLGGPIIKDKLWFYVGGQYYRDKDQPAGFPEYIDYKQPRGFVKLTAQVTPTLNLGASLEIDQYRGINRDGGANVAPEATVNQSSPETVANFSLTKILSPRTFFDLKAAFFSGYYYLDPEVGMAPYMHHEDEVGFVGPRYYNSSGYFYYADRGRVQANASLSHYVEDFIAGSHDFKFGAEFERSSARDRYGYTGEGGGGPLGDHVQYFDYTGYWGYYYGDYTESRYWAYKNDGYDTKTMYTRLEAFLQDNWQVAKRLNLSLGVRFSQYWGQVKDTPGNVYSANRIAPRVGFTFDILGDKSTILKAHFGRFSEAMLVDYHDRLNPSSAYSDTYEYYWDYPAGEWVLNSHTVFENLYRMDPDIVHPYMDQFTVSLERELFKDASLGLTYIDRSWKKQIAPIDLAAEYYDPYTFTVPSPGSGTVPVYERTEETVDEHDYLITNYNTQTSPYVLQNPYRKFRGVEVLFNKRFSNRWQLVASYVYSWSKGTVDNGTSDDIGYGSRDTMYQGDPNYWTNVDGRSTYTPTHMIKVQASYVIPVIDLSVSAYYRGIGGRFWTPRYRTSYLYQGRVTVLAEPRGSNEYPMQHTLDIRLEKIFTISKNYQLGLLFDVFNLFNADTITSWGTRIGSGADWYATGSPYYTPSTNGHDLLGILNPRQARLGIRLIF
jgi:outer membrane receptor protein involved in Fe transport